MMWFVILLLVLLVFFFFEFRRVKHKIIAVSIILLILFFYFTIPLFLPKGTNLKTISGIEKAVKVYALWFAGAFNNLKKITAEAIHLDWSSNSSEEKTSSRRTLRR